MVREWLHQGAGILEVRFYLWCDLSARVHFDWYSLDQIHFPVPGVNGSYTKILPGLFGRGEFFCAEKVLFGNGSGRTSSSGEIVGPADTRCSSRRTLSRELGESRKQQSELLQIAHNSFCYAMDILVYPALP